MAVSQKQVAERVGVSIALVSRVLSGKARDVGIAQSTIERVMQVATEMGYVPNAAALTLKGKATRTIGVVVYDFKDPFFGAIIEELQAQAHEHGYSLVLAGFKKRVPKRPIWRRCISMPLMDSLFSVPMKRPTGSMVFMTCPWRVLVMGVLKKRVFGLPLMKAMPRVSYCTISATRAIGI